MEQKGPKIAESRNLTQSSCKGLSGVLAVEPVLPAVGVRGAPSAWRHSWKDSPHTHTMSHTPSFMWLQLFPPQITRKLWWWGLGYLRLCGPLCFSFPRRSENSCRNTQTFGKEADLTAFPARLQAERNGNILQAYFPEIPVRTALAISWLPIWPQNRTSSSSKSICFFTLALALHLNMQFSQVQ